MPSIWLRAIINLILKGLGKDPYVPINYRGISLLSSISKCYTSIMNERLVKLCDKNQILVDEQNGFRKHRSCNDHLFSLTSIIRNILATNMSTYCAFIDMEKAFDFVNRKLLYCCLLSYNVTGKIYRSIKALYRHIDIVRACECHV